jgi:hypothetical protein
MHHDFTVRHDVTVAACWPPEQLSWFILQCARALCGNDFV